MNVKELIGKLDDSSKEVRIEAVLALGELEEDVEVAVPVLIELLREDWEFEVRYRAAETLGKIGKRVATEKIVIVLVEKLCEIEVPMVERMAETAIEKLGKKVIPTLIKVMNEHEDWFVQFRAVKMIQKFGKEAEDFTPELIQKLREEDSYEVRSSLLQTLQMIGIQKPVIFKEILFLLRNDKDWQIRQAAVWALDTILRAGPGKQEEIVVLALAKVMEKDKHDYVRGNAYSALQIHARRLRYYDEIELIHEYKLKER